MDLRVCLPLILGVFLCILGFYHRNGFIWGRGLNPETPLNTPMCNSANGLQSKTDFSTTCLFIQISTLVLSLRTHLLQSCCGRQWLRFCTAADVVHAILYFALFPVPIGCLPLLERGLLGPCFLLFLPLMAPGALLVPHRFLPGSSQQLSLRFVMNG